MTIKPRATRCILIRCAPELRAAYEARARESGCTLSHEVRRALIRDVVTHLDEFVDETVEDTTASPAV